MNFVRVKKFGAVMDERENSRNRDKNMPAPFCPPRVHCPVCESENHQLEPAERLLLLTNVVDIISAK
jgi:hypothetical protein